MAASCEGREMEYKEELVVWREVLPSSYPKGSLWLEVTQQESWAKIKADGKEEVQRVWSRPREEHFRVSSELCWEFP